MKMLAPVIAGVLLLLHGAHSGQSSLNYFMDNLLRSVPKDTFKLKGADFEVDVQNDTVLEFYPFQLLNGTATRFRRRVQRLGDCRTARSGGANVITCPLSFAGLTASYVVESETPAAASRDVHFFVYEGRGQIEVAATPGRRTQMTAFSLQFLNVTMQKMGSVLVHPDVDEIFAKKAAENVERTLWEALVDSYAPMMREVVGGIRTPPVIS